jgi:predicted AAA+ superfamily ATPase
MLVERSLASAFRDLFASYPIVTVTGPRQSGKTTLCRLLFPVVPRLRELESSR